MRRTVLIMNEISKASRQLCNKRMKEKKNRKMIKKQSQRQSHSRVKITFFQSLSITTVRPDIVGISGGLCSGCTLLSMFFDLYSFIGIPLASFPFLYLVFILYFQNKILFRTKSILVNEIVTYFFWFQFSGQEMFVLVTFQGANQYF